MNETIGIIPRAFRRRGVWVACTLLLRAGLNFLGLAMLLPVLALVLDPGSLEGGGMLARAYDGLGFASQRSFALAVCAAVVGVIVLKSLLGLWLARVERNYIFALYRTLSRRLLVTYHDRGLPFVKASNSAVLARNVNVVCLAFAAGVLKPAAAIAAEAMLLVLLFGALMWYTPLAALLALAVFLPSIWLYYGLVRNRINRYGELENKAQREKARLVAETFRGYADIEINNAFPMMLRQFDRAMDQVIRTRLRETAIGLLPQTFTEVGLAVGMALLVALSLGDGDGRAQMLFGVFAVAALRLMPSVRNIMTGWTAIKYNRYTIGILRDAAADCPPAPANPDCRDTPGPRSTPAATVAPGNSGNPGKPGNPGNPAADTASSPEKLPFRHEIAVRALRFRFADGGRELFHGLSLTIRKSASVSAEPRAPGKRRSSTCCWDCTSRPGVKSSSTARRLRRPTAGHGRTASGTSRKTFSSPTAASRPTSRWASPPGRSTGSGSCRRSTRHSSGSWSPGWRKGSTPTSGSAAAASRADSASASASPVRSTGRPTCFSSTRRPRRSTAAPKRRSTARSPGSLHGMPG